MQRDGKRKWFVMNQPETSAEAAAPAPDISGALRAHRDYVRLILRELHHNRKFNEELKMKVSELTLKVDALIAAALEVKDRPPVVVTPPDDPEVEALSRRINVAIAALKGEQPAETPAGVAGAFDPNAPV